MDKLIFLSLLLAGALHIFEEYVYPGGFADAFKKLLPRASHVFTTNFHIVVNLIFYLLCIISAIIGKSNLILSISVFGLIFTNALLHIRGAVVRKGYYPGVITALLIYIPLTIYAYYHFINTKQLSWIEAILSFILGMSYMVSLMIYVLVQQRKEI
jgi:hypothetical protein